jgi:hypothetical protein
MVAADAASTSAMDVLIMVVSLSFAQWHHGIKTVGKVAPSPCLRLYYPLFPNANK